MLLAWPKASVAGILLDWGQASHPLYTYWEIADEVETARNSGIWRAGYTDDGLHPTATGINAAAAGVDVADIVSRCHYPLPPRVVEKMAELAYN